MSNTVIQLKFSAATGNTPTALANGELAINTYDGKIFYRGGASNTIQSITRFTGPAGLDTELQFNDSGSLGGSEKLTFNKTTGLLTVSGTVRANIFSDDGVDLYDFSNNAFNTANAAFLAANASTATDTTQNNSITAAFTAANSSGIYANAAFAWANTISAGSVDTFARNQANAAFSQANTAQSTATSAQGTASSAASTASGAQSTASAALGAATTAQDTATASFIQANAAFSKANTSSGSGNASFADYFPTGDWGTIIDATTSAFGEDLTVLYDCRVDPITPKNYLLTKDLGYLA